MATSHAPKVTRVVPDDGPPFIIAMIVLFAVSIPVLFGAAWWLSPHTHISPAVRGTTAAPAAEAAPAEAAPAEAAPAEEGAE